MTTPSATPPALTVYHIGPSGTDQSPFYIGWKIGTGESQIGNVVPVGFRLPESWEDVLRIVLAVGRSILLTN